MSEATAQIIERLPSPEEVQRRLSECVREAAMLRSLLRVTRKAKPEHSKPCKREVIARG